MAKTVRTALNGQNPTKFSRLSRPTQFSWKFAKEIGHFERTESVPTGKGR